MLVPDDSLEDLTWWKSRIICSFEFRIFFFSVRHVRSLMDGVWFESSWSIDQDDWMNLRNEFFVGFNANRSLPMRTNPACLSQSSKQNDIAVSRHGCNEICSRTSNHNCVVLIVCRHTNQPSVRRATECWDTTRVRFNFHCSMMSKWLMRNVDRSIDKWIRMTDYISDDVVPICSLQTLSTSECSSCLSIAVNSSTCREGSRTGGV